MAEKKGQVTTSFFIIINVTISSMHFMACDPLLQIKRPQHTRVVQGKVSFNAIGSLGNEPGNPDFNDLDEITICKATFSAIHLIHRSWKTPISPESLIRRDNCAIRLTINNLIQLNDIHSWR